MSIERELARLKEQAQARAQARVKCTCLKRHIEVTGRVEFVDGVAHEFLELTPEQELIVESQRTCKRDYGNEICMTIVPPIPDDVKVKLGLLV